MPFTPTPQQERIEANMERIAHLKKQLTEAERQANAWLNLVGKFSGQIADLKRENERLSWDLSPAKARGETLVEFRNSLRFRVRRRTFREAA